MDLTGGESATARATARVTCAPCAPSVDGMIVDREKPMHSRECSGLPSECHCDHVSWIWAERRDRSSSYCYRSGKWMLFTDSADVDEAWFQIVDLLAAGELGNCAKVAPIKSTKDGLHLICVYTDDHENVKEVFTVLRALRRSKITCAAERTLNYKTDDATAAGQYSSSGSAQRAGFSDASAPRHKNHKISKYTSPGFKGVRNVRLVLNNIGPNFLHEVVAEMPITATNEEVHEYFAERLPTASEIEAFVLGGGEEEECEGMESYTKKARIDV